MQLCLGCSLTAVKQCAVMLSQDYEEVRMQLVLRDQCTELILCLSQPPSYVQEIVCENCSTCCRSASWNHHSWQSWWKKLSLKGKWSLEKGTEQPRAEQGADSLSCKLQTICMSHPMWLHSKGIRGGEKGGKGCQLQTTCSISEDQSETIQLNTVFLQLSVHIPVFPKGAFVLFLLSLRPSSEGSFQHECTNPQVSVAGSFPSAFIT